MSNSNRPTLAKPEEAFKEWLLHPVTQHFRAWVNDMRQDLMETWASGNFQESEAKNQQALGQAKLLAYMGELPEEAILGDAE